MKIRQIGTLIKESRETKDVVYLFVLQIANHIIPLITTPYLMIVLGAGNYGILGFAFSITQYLLLIVDFGFNMSSTKRVASVDKSEIPKIFTSVIIAKSALLFCSLLLIAIVFFLDSMADYRLAILCFIPFVIANTYTFFWLFQGLGKVRIISMINTICKMGILPLTFILVKSHDDVYLAILIQSSVYVMVCIVSNIYVWHYKLVHFRRVSLINIKEEFSEGFPLFLSTAATSIYTQLFTIFLGFTATKEEVGCFSAAERIMRSLCFLYYIPISQAFFPKIAALASKNRHEAVRYIYVLLRITFVIMLMLSLTLSFGANFLVKCFGKDDYGLLPVILRIISIVPIAIGSGAIVGQMGLIALGDYKSKIHFRNTYVIVAVLSVLIVLVLGNSFGIYGISISLVLSEYGVALLMIYYFRKTKKRLFA